MAEERVPSCSIELPEKFNVTTRLLDHNLAQGRGDKVVLYFQDRKYTFREINDSVNRLGNALKSLGVEMENRVAILLPDCPEWAVSLFAILKIGAVAVPLNTMLKPSDYEYILGDSRAKVLIASPDLLEKVEEVKGKLKHLKHIVAVGDARSPCLSFKGLLQSASPELETADTLNEDVALLFYTSGTTGTPKGTIHLHHDLCCEPIFFAEAFWGMGEKDIKLCVPRLFFHFGAQQLINTFWVGCTQVLDPEKPTAERYFELITKFKPSHFFAVPTFFARMLAVTDTSCYDLSSVKMCNSGGERLPLEMRQSFEQRFGISIYETIGSTEMGGAFISSRPGQYKPGALGVCVPGMELKIVDEEGKKVPVGEVGELLVKGEGVSPGYWHKHQTNKKTFLGEWVRTGDLFRCDEDGYYWYIGRADEVIKAGGIKVVPTDVEAVLAQHPAVLEAAVVGAPDEMGLEKPKAFIVLKEGYKASVQLADELKKLVKERMAPYNYPRWVEFLTELPKTATGKVQRFKLRNPS